MIQFFFFFCISPPPFFLSSSCFKCVFCCCRFCLFFLKKINLKQEWLQRSKNEIQTHKGFNHMCFVLINSVLFNLLCVWMLLFFCLLCLKGLILVTSMIFLYTLVFPQNQCCNRYYSIAYSCLLLDCVKIGIISTLFYKQV